MQRIKQDISSGQFNRLYLLCGDDEYLRTFYRNKLKQALISPDDTMNLTEFSGKDTDVNNVIDIARTIPFLSERRVVIVNDSGFFNPKGKKEKDASDDEEDEEAGTASEQKSEYGLPEFFKEIPETTVLIFCEEAVKKNIRIYKAAAKYGYVAQFDKIKENDAGGIKKLESYILGKIAGEQKNITRSAMDLLIERTGTDLFVVYNELEKLLSYIGEREAVTQEDVKELVPERLQDKVFEMIENISAYKQKEALDLYYDLLRKKEQPVKILSLIERHYHQLYAVKSLSSTGMNWKDVLMKAQIKPIDFLYRKYTALASKYSFDELKNAMQMCLDYDKAYRSGKIKDNVAVEVVIVTMSSRKKAAV